MNDQAVDNQLHGALKMLDELVAELDDDEELSLEQASALMRLAYGKGYMDGAKQPDQETARRLAIALGLLNPETGEIC